MQDLVLKYDKLIPFKFLQPLNINSKFVTFLVLKEIKFIYIIFYNLQTYDYNQINIDQSLN